MGQCVSVGGLVLGQGLPKICVPLTGGTEEQILRQADKAMQAGVDLVEWRVDYFEQVEQFSCVKKLLRQLRSILGATPIVFTFRTASEGGNCELSLRMYQELCQQVLRTGLVDLLDVELYSGKEIVIQLIQQAHQFGALVILSHHDFEKTPDQQTMLDTLCCMQQWGADIVKIAVMPQAPCDVLRLLETGMMYSQKQDACPLISISMGQLGRLSRVSGGLFGCCISFGSLGDSSAPGQIEAGELRQILKVLYR